MIHSTAIIDPKAKIASDVTIGPYSIIGEDVEIGAGCDIASHVVINGPTTIGKNNKIFQFSSIGDKPQDKKHQSQDDVCLEIGDNNVIREYVTINLGTINGGGITKVGNNNWIMAYVHIAHDCIIGNDNIFANNASLAGHVTIDDWVILGGFTLVSQFNYLASHCFTAMGSVISQNIPPYILVSGHMAKPVGINIEGLKRRDFNDIQIRNIRYAYKLLYRSCLRIEQAKLAIADIEQEANELDLFAEFFAKQEGAIIR